MHIIRYSVRYHGVGASEANIGYCEAGLIRMLGIEKIAVSIAAILRKMHFKFREVVTAPFPFAPNYKI